MHSSPGNTVKVCLRTSISINYHSLSPCNLVVATSLGSSSIVAKDQQSFVMLRVEELL